MIYTTKERNAAILSIGHGNAEVSDALFYDALQQFHWINITKQVNGTQVAALTYSGKDLFRKLLKSV